MTGYARKSDKNAIMSLRANNKQLSKNYDKMWEKVENLMRIDFERNLFMVMMINT